MASFDSSGPLIFLDIDGVLNGHQYMREAQSCNICRPCVLQLNRVLRSTGAKIVLSSAWRYMVWGKAMSLTGFGYMLRTHGLIGATGLLVGATAPDEECPHCGHRHKLKERKWGDDGYIRCVRCGERSTRGAQISRWLKAAEYAGRYVVLDDEDYDIRAAGHPLVQTRSKHGLSRRKADEAIRVLSNAE